MTTEPPGKLRILVVDDNEQWLDSLQNQSNKLARSKLEIQASSSFSDGLRFIENNKEVDVVVVDYFLDRGHLASEFISKARELGLIVPYVIVSGAQSVDLLNDSSDIDNLVQSAPSDFIEKIDIKSFISFQDRIFQSYRKFQENLMNALSSYLQTQKEGLQGMWILCCEIRLLHSTIESYAKKIDDPSFSRVCSVISRDTDCLLSYLSGLFNLFPDGQHGRSGGLIENAEIRSNNGLGVADCIPYSSQKKSLLLWLKSCEKKLDKIDPNTENLSSMVSYVIKKEDKSKQQFAELVILHLADRFATLGRPQHGADLLYCLSQALARRRQNKRVAGTDLLTAAYLIENGYPEEAYFYVAAAEKLMGRKEIRPLEQLIHLN
jgi:CheY-like chemotaxis protein